MPTRPLSLADRRILIRKFHYPEMRLEHSPLRDTLGRERQRATEVASCLAISNCASTTTTFPAGCAGLLAFLYLHLRTQNADFGALWFSHHNKERFCSPLSINHGGSLHGTKVEKLREFRFRETTVHPRSGDTINWVCA